MYDLLDAISLCGNAVVDCGIKQKSGRCQETEAANQGGYHAAVCAISGALAGEGCYHAAVRAISRALLSVGSAGRNKAFC